MNVPAFTRTLTDDELKTAITELRAIEETGLIPDGLFRSLVADVSLLSDMSLPDAHKILSTSILQAAAYKWAGLDNDATKFTVPVESLTPDPFNTRVQPITDVAQLVPGSHYAIGFKSPLGHIDWGISQVARFIGPDYCCDWIDRAGHPIGAVLNIYSGERVPPSAAEAYLPKEQ